MLILAKCKLMFSMKSLWFQSSKVHKFFKFNYKFLIAQNISFAKSLFCFSGNEAIISVLGFPKQLEEPMTKFTESMSAILKAMNIAQVTRIITISAWYTNPETRQGK